MAKTKNKFVVIDEVGKIISVHDSYGEAQEQSYGDCVILEVVKQMNVDYEKVFIGKKIGDGLC